MRVLLIRANRNGADVTALSRYRIDSRIDPYLNISALPNHDGAQRMLAALKTPGPKWLIATSTNALSYWSKLLPADELEAAIRSQEIRFAAIGNQTANQLRELGAKEVLVAGSKNGQSLADQLISTDPMPVVLPSGSIAMRDIPNQLGAHGFEILSEVVYVTETVNETPPSVLEIARGELDAVLFRSPSAVRAFLHFNKSPNLLLFCAGNTTARELGKFGLDADFVASEPDPEAVALAISEYFEARNM